MQTNLESCIKRSGPFPQPIAQVLPQNMTESVSKFRMGSILKT
jgi:hypothetical protein